MSPPRPPGARAPALPLAALVAAALALAFAWAAGPARAAPSYPALTGRVVDDAHVLSAEQTSELTGKLAALERSTGRQLVVATVPSLQDTEIEAYGVGLLRAWGIGQKGENDGAILIVAPTEKKVRVEVGYGLEGVLTDALSELIIQHQVLPRFRAGDVGGGVVAGTDALIAQLQLPADQAQQSAADAASQQASARAQPQRSRGGWIFLALFGVWFLSTAWGFLTGHRGRRYGGGGGSGWGWILPMMLLNGLSSRSGRDDDWGGGGFGGGGDGGGFSGGGGSGGGGGASGSW